MRFPDSSGNGKEQGMTIEVQGLGAFSEVKFFHITEQTDTDGTREGLFIGFLDGDNTFFPSVQSIGAVTIRKF